MEVHNIGAKFHVLSAEEFHGMKECIHDQGARIKELENDIEVWRIMYADMNRALLDSVSNGEKQAKEAADKLAQEKAEGDLFHAAYVGMCTMHPEQPVFIGHSQQEH